VPRLRKALASPPRPRLRRVDPVDLPDLQLGAGLHVLLADARRLPRRPSRRVLVRVGLLPLLAGLVVLAGARGVGVGARGRAAPPLRPLELLLRLLRARAQLLLLEAFRLGRHA